MIDQLHAHLRDRGADAAWISDPVSIAYLTGFRANPHERLMGLAVGRGMPVLLVPGLEEAAAATTAQGVQVTGWRDGQDPYALAAAALGGSARALAVEKTHLTLAVAESLRTAVGAVDILDVGEAVRGLRERKRPDELELLQRAAEVTDLVAARVRDFIAAGVSEIEVARRLETLILDSGCSLSFDTAVQSGPNSAQPHLGPTSRRLADGDLVLLDFGAAWHGYRADLTRTFVLGRPSPRQQEMLDAVRDAHDAAIAAVRAGVTAGEVDRAARTVIEERGLGEHFIHRVGHGLGLEIHEGPSLDPGSPLRLEAGMVVTIEPGVYIAGLGGVRIEDDVVVERDGARLLTHAEHSPVLAGE